MEHLKCSSVFIIGILGFKNQTSPFLLLRNYFYQTYLCNINHLSLFGLFSSCCFLLVCLLQLLRKREFVVQKVFYQGYCLTEFTFASFLTYKTTTNMTVHILNYRQLQIVIVLFPVIVWLILLQLCIMFTLVLFSLLGICFSDSCMII